MDDDPNQAFGAVVSYPMERADWIENKVARPYASFFSVDCCDACSFTDDHHVNDLMPVRRRFLPGLEEAALDHGVVACKRRRRNFRGDKAVNTRISATGRA